MIHHPHPPHHPRYTVLSAALLLSLAGTGGAALVQADAAKPEAEPSGQVLSFEKLDLERILIDPKDAALRAALKLAPERLKLIPGEVRAAGGNWEAPPQVIDLLARLEGAPLRVGVTYNPQKPVGGFFGAGIVVSFAQRGEQQAAETQALVNGLMAQVPDAPAITPSKSFAGMSELTTPIGQLRFGPRQAADGWAYELHIGSVGDPDGASKNIALATLAGVTPFIRARVDVAPLSPLLGFVQMLAGADPAIATTVQNLQEGGIIGPDAAKINLILGHTPDRTVVATSYVGLGKRAEKAGMTQETLGDDELGAIPEDAQWVSIGKTNMSYYRAQLDTAIAAAGPARDMLEQLKAQTGVDLVGDLFSSLGNHYATYISDATGGGTLGSGVVLIGLSDPAKFRAANKKLVDFANKTLLEGPPRGYVNIRRWIYQTDGVDYFTISFPGLPVPLEPTYAITDRWLVLGATPQAAAMAARQISGKAGPGLFATPAVKSLYPAGQKFVTMSYANAPRLARGGYAFVSLFGSAVQNAIVNKLDPTSTAAPFIVPPFAELMVGVKPEIGYSHWTGDDFISRWEGDKSLLVNMSSAGGKVSILAPVIGSAMAAAAAAFQQGENGFPELMGNDGDDGQQEKMEPRRGPSFRIVP